MSTPYLKIEDASGNSYSFPPSLFLTSDPFSVRSSIKELMYAHGAKDVGDGFVGSRTLTVEGHVFADDAASFETAWRALMLAVMKGGKLTVSNDAVSRYMTVSSPAVDSEWEHWPNFKNVTLTFRALFPFWQAASETMSSHVLAGNASFTVDASGSDHVLMPTITIAADQGADVVGVRLRNVSDGGATLEYDNPFLTAGSVLTIDCNGGTIKLNGNDAIGYFVSGAFLRLQPKVNTIYFEGAACTVTFSFRKIYL
jgi:phage-related protein